jgi:hypothetical protein
MGIAIKEPLLTIKEPCVRFVPALGAEIGENESILLLRVEYWLRQPDAEEHDGKWWTCQSSSKMKEFFRVWSEKTIDRTINSLVAQSLLFVGKYNEYKFDRTRWFAINPEGVKGLKSITLNTEESQ